MKKLMFGLALAAVAFGAQAAKIDWAIDAKSIQTETGGNMSGETAYLLMFDTAAAASSYQAGLADGTIKISDATAAAIDSATSTYTTTKSAGKIDKRTVTVSSADAGDKAYFAIFVADTANNKFMMGAASQGQFYEPGDTNFGDASGVQFSSARFSATGTTGWNTNGGTSPIPEPTSGLLLLVGAGMLALRRKQK